jgi:hypothetical protein
MLFKGSNNLVQIYRSFAITGNYGYMNLEKYKIQDTRYFIFQIRAPGGHDAFIISTYTINKVKYNNYFITINHVCHRLEQREVIQLPCDHGHDGSSTYMYII